MLRSIGSFVIAALLVGAVGQAARAGVLPTDPAALPFSQGSVVINGQDFSAKNTFKALVEYAVYDIGDFSTSAALGFPVDPSGGTQYIYAYQLQNTGVDEALSLFSVNLVTGAVANNASIVGFLAGPNLNPINSAFNPPTVGMPKTNVRWTFSTGAFSIGQTSDVLYFASPNPYQWRIASITGMNATAGSGLVPSPVPEPATCALAATGAMCLLAVRHWRRRRHA
jgi:hypothetical protein